MRVTVCQWPDTADALARAWEGLVRHVRAHASELVLLPEMPFYPWLAASPAYDAGAWAAAIEAHDAWEARFPELGGSAIIATRPVDFGNERYDEGFVWQPDIGSRAVHAKSLLPNEAGAWERTWYHAANPEFTPMEIGVAHIGFLISTELWLMEQARVYGQEGVALLLIPRVTGSASREKWFCAGRVASVLAGAFGLSSNRADATGAFGGQGWAISPDGDLLDVTSDDAPFVTLDLDLSYATRARQTYPRNLFQKAAPQPNPPT